MPRENKAGYPARKGATRRHFTLYGTSACHLCEEAEAMARAALQHLTQCCVECIDISVSDDLMLRYGDRIPVLLHPDGRALDWPFSAQALACFMTN